MACLQPLSTPSPSYPGSNVENRIPFEFIELIKKTKSICSIKKFDPVNESKKLGCSVTTPSRDVKVGSDVQGRNIIFIKSSGSPRRHKVALQEQIAFMISNRLNLNVVPPTIAIEGYKNIVDQNISHDTKEHFLSVKGNYDGVVVQDAISLNSKQIETMRNAASYYLSFLDTDQLCNAIFFNIITGRGDADPANSIVDNLNRVIEVDNEGIGFEKTSSWLLDFFSDFVLPKKPIENLLSKDISIIDGVFNDVSHFPKTNFWNGATGKYDLEDNTQKIMNANFIKLKKFLIENKEKDIKVRHLDKTSDLNETLNLTFSKISIKFDAYYGQSLVVCGTGSDSLDWDPKKALPMKWNAGNIWSIDIETNYPISFKFLLRENNGEMKWMQGDNFNIQPGRNFDLPSGEFLFN